MTTHLTILECSNGNQRRVKFQTNVRSEQTKWLAYRPMNSRRDVDCEPYRPKHDIRQRPHTAKEATRVPVGTALLLPHFSMRNKRASFQSIESVAKASAFKDPSLANQIPCPERMDSICRIHALRGWILYVESTTDVYCGI